MFYQFTKPNVMVVDNFQTHLIAKMESRCPHGGRAMVAGFIKLPTTLVLTPRLISSGAHGLQCCPWGLVPPEG